MQRTRRQRHDQPNNPEADTMPCRMTLMPAPARPVQRQAWACLWRMLLLEDVDHKESQARGNAEEKNDRR